MAHPNLITPEEVAETIAWFKTQKPHIPQEMEVLPGVEARDLPTTVRKYLELADVAAGNATYVGQLSHLVAIRRKLEQMQGGNSAQ